MVRFGPLPGPQLLLQVLQALYNIHVGSSKTKQHSNKQPPPSAGDSEEKQLENGASAEEGGCNHQEKGSMLTAANMHVQIKLHVDMH